MQRWPLNTILHIQAKWPVQESLLEVFASILIGIRNDKIRYLFSVPFYCGIGGLAAATLCMSSPTAVNVNFLITQTNGLAASNFIDPVANIQNDRVFIFHGTQDSTVLPGMVISIL